MTSVNVNFQQKRPIDNDIFFVLNSLVNEIKLRRLLNIVSPCYYGMAGSITKILRD